MIVIFGSMKGGTGKSTVTLLAANAAAADGHAVTICDVDAQKSISKLRLLDTEDFTDALPYPILSQNVATFEKEAQDLDARNDFIFVDVPGKLDEHLPPEYQEISRVLNYADFLFIPFTPGNFALEASLSYLQFAQRAAATRPEERPLKIIGFVNMHRDRSRNARFLQTEIDQLKNILSVPFMNAKLNLYTAFADVDTVTSYYEPNSTDAAELNFSVWYEEFKKIVFA